MEKAFKKKEDEEKREASDIRTHRRPGSDTGA